MRKAAESLSCAAKCETQAGSGMMPSISRNDPMAIDRNSTSIAAKTSKIAGSLTLASVLVAIEKGMMAPK